MSPSADNFNKRRLRSAYISVVVSIALVLFVLGLFGVLVINASAIANQVRENFTITLLISNETSPVEVRQFQKSLEVSEKVKSTEYISKEEAAEDLQEELDEEFMDFLGYNPLQNSIEVQLKAPYVTEEWLADLEKEYREKDFVSDVVYDRPLIQMMNDNIERISFFLIGGSILLTLISIALINSSIRLSIYSRRFIIKTMQLVGATKGFIRRPYLWRSFRHGIYGALLAIALLTGALFYLVQKVPDLTALQNPVNLSVLFGGILVMGILIAVSCTFFALKKYLSLTTDQLYF